MDELEQYTRMNDKVLSVTTHHSYARVTAGDKEREDIPSGELHSLEQVIFFNSKDIPLDAKNIVACYTILQKQNTTKVIIRFANRKDKIDKEKTVKANKEIQWHWSICK